MIDFDLLGKKLLFQQLLILSSRKSFFLAIKTHFYKIAQMKHYPTALSILVLLFFASCENRYRKNVAANSNAANSSLSSEASASKQQVDLAKDAYQVSADEYDEFFTTRYGLLYQKFSDTPFSGRIITAENGPEGKFVVADEGWRNGKRWS